MLEAAGAFLEAEPMSVSNLAMPKAGDPIIHFGDNRIRVRTGEIPRKTLTAEDRRILVKGTVTANYSNEIERSKPVETPLETKITKITHEVEAPTSLFVRFVYIF